MMIGAPGCQEAPVAAAEPPAAEPEAAVEAPVEANFTWGAWVLIPRGSTVVPFWLWPIV